MIDACECLSDQAGFSRGREAIVKARRKCVKGFIISKIIRFSLIILVRVVLVISGCVESAWRRCAGHGVGLPLDLGR
jgi:hypothetical protein